MRVIALGLIAIMLAGCGSESGHPSRRTLTRNAAIARATCSRAGGALAYRVIRNRRTHRLILLARCRNGATLARTLP